MIVRGPNRVVTDHGPSEGRTLRPSISGSLAQPASPSARVPSPKVRTYINEWKRTKRRTDPEWAERERAQKRVAYRKDAA